MIRYEDFMEEVRRLKAERWAKILASEPPGRVAGRRPRDPEQERLLTEADRRRVESSELLSKGRQEEVEGTGASPTEAMREADSDEGIC